MNAKKILSLLLVVVMLLSLAACSGSVDSEDNDNVTPSGDNSAPSGDASNSDGNDNNNADVSDVGEMAASGESIADVIVPAYIAEGITRETAAWFRGDMNVYTSANGGNYTDKDPNTLTIGSGNQIIGCEPLNSQDEYPWSYNVYEPLIFRNWETGEFEPGLATEWAYDDEGNFHITLRENVKFHDGTTLDADDVFYTLKRNADASKSQVHDACAAINFEKSYAEDDLHLVIVFDHPAASFIDALATSFLGIMSSEFMAEHGEDYDFFEADAGSGAYTVIETNSGLDQVFERFDDYWGEAPHYQYIRCILYKDYTVGVIDFTNGDIDVLQSINNYDAAMRFFYGELDSTVCYQLPINRGYVIYLNNTEGPCADENVRLAIACAINYEELVYGVYQGNELGMISTTVTFPGSRYAISDGTYEYDPDKAMELLAAAGYSESNPLKLTIETSDNAASRAACEQIQYQLSLVGIELECVFEKSAAMTATSNATEYTYDMCFYPMQLRSGHPSELLAGRDAYGKEVGNYSQLKGVQDERLHELMVAGAQELDEEKAAEIYTEIQYMFHEHAWSIPAMVSTSVCFVRDYVAGVTFTNGYGNLWKNAEAAY